MRDRAAGSQERPPHRMETSGRKRKWGRRLETVVQFLEGWLAERPQQKVSQPSRDSHRLTQPGPAGSHPPAPREGQIPTSLPQRGPRAPDSGHRPPGLLAKEFPSDSRGSAWDPWCSRWGTLSLTLEAAETQRGHWCPTLPSGYPHLLHGVRGLLQRHPPTISMASPVPPMWTASLCDPLKGLPQTCLLQGAARLAWVGTGDTLQLLSLKPQGPLPPTPIT